MTSNATHANFPDGSVCHDFDLFEQFPDGSTLWRGCVVGKQNVESKLQELARLSANAGNAPGSTFFAVDLHDMTQPVVRLSLPPTAGHPRRAPQKPTHPQ